MPPRKPALHPSQTSEIESLGGPEGEGNQEAEPKPRKLPTIFSSIAGLSEARVSFVNAYIFSGGSALQAAKVCGVSVQDHFDAMRESAYGGAIALANEILNEELEAAAVSRALGGNDDLLEFVLKARLSDRYGNKAVPESPSDDDVSKDVATIIEDPELVSQAERVGSAIQKARGDRGALRK